MNLMERDKGEARLHYLDGEYEIITPGGYVACAVTGTHIKKPINTARPRSRGRSWVFCSELRSGFVSISSFK